MLHVGFNNKRALVLVTIVIVTIFITINFASPIYELGDSIDSTLRKRQSLPTPPDHPDRPDFSKTSDSTTILHGFNSHNIWGVSMSLFIVISTLVLMTFA
ncbi:hypothetical protein C1646_752017 [Rhizophagus diaphanus]|nr:hypothetical protein C1646_752017 [Rhizophagus diaphanus] [Rhizophagus sp. MUCL 43196]